MSLNSSQMPLFDSDRPNPIDSSKTAEVKVLASPVIFSVRHGLWVHCGYVHRQKGDKGSTKDASAGAALCEDKYHQTSANEQWKLVHILRRLRLHALLSEADG